MLRIGGIYLTNTKAVTLAGLLILLAIASVALAHQLAGASNSNLSHTINSVGASPASTNDSSASTEESSNTSSSNTNITVNGQSIPADANGNVDQTIINGNSTTSVKVQNQGQSGSSHTSVNVDVNSSSSSQEGQ